MGFLIIGIIETVYLKIHKKIPHYSPPRNQCGKHQNHPKIGLFNMPYFTTNRNGGKLWQAFINVEKHGHIRSTITRMENKKQ